MLCAWMCVSGAVNGSDIVEQNKSIDSITLWPRTAAPVTSDVPWADLRLSWVRLK